MKKLILIGLFLFSASNVLNAQFVISSIQDTQTELILNDSISIKKGGNIQTYLPLENDFLFIKPVKKFNAKLIGKVADVVGTGASAVGLGSGNIKILSESIKVARTANAVQYGVDALNLFEGIKNKLDESIKKNMLPSTSYVNEDNNPYVANNKDERETIYKAIKARRGQQSFRKNLLEIYESTCVISGCKIVDILEAAHINPYRGEKDNNVGNGLLLRADLHTLFDLDLIQINPENYLVEISDKLIGSEYEQYKGLSLIDFKDLISKEALQLKYEQKNKGG